MESAGRHGGAQTKHSGANMLLQVGKSGFREYAKERINFECDASWKMCGEPSQMPYSFQFAKSMIYFEIDAEMPPGII